MAEVVPHVLQVNLPVHHVRARCVPQPMDGRLVQSLGITVSDGSPP